jgi:hypothetical protein
MSRRECLVIAALALAWWPLPLGMGYLLLRRWARFVITLVVWLFGMQLVGAVLGTAAEPPVLGIIWLVAYVDIVRLAVREWRLLSGAASPGNGQKEEE